MKSFITSLIAIILLITAGVLFKSEITGILQERSIRSHFDSSQGNKLTPEGYAPEIVGDLQNGSHNTQGEQ